MEMRMGLYENPYSYSSLDVLPTPSTWKGKSAKTTVNFSSHRVGRTWKSVKPYWYLLFGIIVGFIFSRLVKAVFVKDEQCFQNSVTPGIESSFSESEIRPRKLLFVGVMTATQFLNSRALAIYRTWGNELGTDIVFFSSENSIAVSNIPLVKLKGVDDSYPPQKKSFMMLSYMYDNLVDRYEYFMRADDDLFVKVDALSSFLRSLNSSEPLYIGQPGLGLGTEYGQLSLNDQENYCMGGPGMIFSHTTIRKIGPHIPSCFRAMKTSHEDVEIGRCVQKYADCPCTWSYDMRDIFHHISNAEETFSGSLRQTNIEKAITVHPLKQPNFMHKMYAFSKEMQMRDTETRIITLMRDIKQMDKVIGSPSDVSLDLVNDGVFIDHLGWDATLHGSDMREVIPWDYVNKSVFSYKDQNPNHRPTVDLKQGITDVIRDLMKQLDSASNERGRTLVFKEFLYGYHRLNAGIASQYIVDILMLYRQYRGSKRSVNVRRHAYIQQPFGPLYIRESPPHGPIDEYSHFNSIINYMVPKDKQDKITPTIVKKEIVFILPLAGRIDAFKRFIKNFEDVCLKPKENARMIIAYESRILDEEDKMFEVYDISSKLQWKYNVPIEMYKIPTKFARAHALQFGIDLCKKEDLMFFIDVDMVFTKETLDRIRWHTVQHQKAYFPIVFSEYDPRVSRPIKSNVGSDYDHFQIDNEVGYWRHFGYGIASIYKSDYEKVGGFNTTITGWGGEDVDLFDKIIKDKDMEIMRSHDPGLVHVFHEVHCDEKLSEKQLAMCQKSFYNTYASQIALSKLIEGNASIFYGH